MFSYTIPSFITTGIICASIILPLLASIFVALRVHVRRITSTKKLRLDDWLIILTLALCWADSVNAWVGAALIGVNTTHMAPLRYASTALRTVWISGFFEVTELAFVKLSVLAFYGHLFHISKRFRISVYLMMGVIGAWWISSVLCELLATDPISGSWDVTHAHTRFNFDIWFITYSGMSIVFDLLILCFPIPMIRGLKLDLKRKLSIIAVFWLGAFCVIAALIRFYYLYTQLFKLVLQEDKYTTITPTFLWGIIEPNCSIIAASLPTYGPLFRDERARASIFRPFRTVYSLFTGIPPNKSVASGNRSEYKDIESGDAIPINTLPYLEMYT